jgi:hypothetical protein
MRIHATICRFPSSREQPARSCVARQVGELEQIQLLLGHASVPLRSDGAGDCAARCPERQQTQRSPAADIYLRLSNATANRRTADTEAGIDLAYAVYAFAHGASEEEVLNPLFGE